ncbi:hypothetical protein NL676_039592 [Syzygium grande]|nr:hypothetical protein NL676_039592 [Syzygium grande]
MGKIRNKNSPWSKRKGKSPAPRASDLSSTVLRKLVLMARNQDGEATESESASFRIYRRESMVLESGVEAGENRSESAWVDHETCGEEGGARRKWERTVEAEAEARARARRKRKRERERGARQKRKREGRNDDGGLVVGKQQESYQQSFCNHAAQGVESATINKWKGALQSVSRKRGWELEKFQHGDHELIKEVVLTVRRLLRKDELWNREDIERVLNERKVDAVEALSATFDNSRSLPERRFFRNFSNLSLLALDLSDMVVLDLSWCTSRTWRCWRQIMKKAKNLKVLILKHCGARHQFNGCETATQFQADGHHISMTMMSQTLKQGGGQTEARKLLVDEVWLQSSTITGE